MTIVRVIDMKIRLAYFRNFDQMIIEIYRLWARTEQFLNLIIL